MNFTNSPYEKMMKECGNRKDRCRKKFRPSGQVGPKS